MNIITIIWLIGIIPTYIICKLFFFKRFVDPVFKEGEWGAVIFYRIVPAIFWPFALLILGIETVTNYLDNTKPPKWL